MRGAGGGGGGGSWSHTRIVLSAPWSAQKSLKLNREQKDPSVHIILLGNKTRCQLASYLHSSISVDKYL